MVNSARVTAERKQGRTGLSRVKNIMQPDPNLAHCLITERLGKLLKIVLRQKVTFIVNEPLKSSYPKVCHFP